MIARRHIIGLGLTQIVCWGVSFYLIGVFGELISADLGWSSSLVHGGFSVALLVMGLASPLVGKLIDQHGGRRVLSFGSVVLAVGCAMLASVETVGGYYFAWAVLGVAMRCALYDAAFAALARIAGPAARKPISQITLLGGLSATCFWPIGHALSEALGWRGALLVYSALSLATLAVHLSLPNERFDEGRQVDALDAALPTQPDRQQRVRAALFVAIVMLGNALHAGMSSHLISILTEFGLGAALAVSAASMRGIGQSAGRLVEVATGSRMHPIDLNLLAVVLLLTGFVIGLASGVSVAAAFGFTFVYGVGTGLMTITRGALPLVLFDPRTYGTYVGKLLVPGFVASAAAPYLFALVVDGYGAAALMGLALGLIGVILAASIVLKTVEAGEDRV